MNLYDILWRLINFLKQMTGGCDDTSKKIEGCCHDVVFQNMYSMTTTDNEQRRFKQAVIHIICTKPNVDPKKLPTMVSRLYRSKDPIPSHDEVVAIDELQFLTDECKKIMKCFTDVGIHSMYSMITKKGKQKRYKQALIHAMYMDPSISVKDLPKALLRLYHSKEDIPSHDDIVTVDNLKDCTEPVAGTNRGLVLVLYNDFKEFPALNRNGTGKKDNDEITTLLKKFNIHAIEGGNNLKNKAEFDRLVSRAINVINDERPDVFLCVVSSHGEESPEGEVRQNVQENRSHVVKHQFSIGDSTSIFTNDLTAKFNDANCPELRGKPRLFFIQACRFRNGVYPLDIGHDLTYAGQLNDQVEEGHPDAMPQIEEGQPDALSQKEEGQPDALSQKEEGQPDALSQKEEGQPDALSQKEEGQPDALSQKEEGQPDALSQKEEGQPDALSQKEEGQPDALSQKEEGQPDALSQKEEGQPDALSQKEEGQPDALSQKEEEKSKSDSNGVDDKNPVYYEVTEDICYEDCLVMFSSPPEKFAWRRKDSTSFLIDCLKIAFESWEKQPELELMEVLTLAAEEMCNMTANHRGKEYKCVPSLQHRLTKEIRLKSKQLSYE